jgi:D-sedoheptulose 7-phosphate isomerase
VSAIGDQIRTRFAERARALERAAALADGVEAAARAMAGALRGGGTVYACGNGGSASQAAHAVCELVGRFKRERGALRAVSLVDNPATLTAVSNDYGFADVFSRQIAGVIRRGDCLLALSTSGESENVVRACATARAAGATVIALTGEAGGRVAAAASLAIRVPDADTPRVQEIHLLVIHLLCELIESALAGPGDAAATAP